MKSVTHPTFVFYLLCKDHNLTCECTDPDVTITNKQGGYIDSYEYNYSQISITPSETVKTYDITCS